MIVSGFRNVWPGWQGDAVCLSDARPAGECTCTHARNITAAAATYDRSGVCRVLALGAPCHGAIGRSNDATALLRPLTPWAATPCAAGVYTVHEITLQSIAATRPQYVVAVSRKQA